MNNTAVKISGVSKVYDRISVVNNLSLGIEEGEIFYAGRLKTSIGVILQQTI